MPAPDSKGVERITFRWADIDANFHVRHSVYYDLGSQQRVNVLAAHGLTMSDMQRGNFGPVLFREECRFFKEIKPEDVIELVPMLKGLSKDYRKFTINHAFMRDDVCCAVVQVEGAWFNSIERKIFVPPHQVVDAMNGFPRAEEFEWLERSRT